MAEPSESKLISESDEVEDIVSNNGNLSTVESKRKTCAAKRLLHSNKVKDLTGTAEAFELFWYGTFCCYHHVKLDIGVWVSTV